MLWAQKTNSSVSFPQHTHADTLTTLVDIKRHRRISLKGHSLTQSWISCQETVKSLLQDKIIFYNMHIVSVYKKTLRLLVGQPCVPECVAVRTNLCKWSNNNNQMSPTPVNQHQLSYLWLMGAKQNWTDPTLMKWILDCGGVVTVRPWRSPLTDRSRLGLSFCLGHVCPCMFMCVCYLLGSCHVSESFFFFGGGISGWLHLLFACISSAIITSTI